MFAFFNPAAAMQQQLNMAQEMLKQGMAFSQAILTAQSQATIELQQTWVDMVKPSTDMPVYAVEGNLIIPEAFVQAQ